jgi:hypothetical protein
MRTTQVFTSRKEGRMFIVKIDGEAVAVTNTFDSAASYADGVRGAGHRVTIASVLPHDLDAVLGTLQYADARPVQRTAGAGAGLWDA